MKTTIRLAKRFTGLFITLIVTITSIVPLNASAGLFDWNSKKEPGLLLASNGSFNELFDGMRNLVAQGDENPLIQETAVVAAGSHVTPNAGKQSSKRKYVVQMSAYSSTPDQTDSSPFITAKGTYVRDGVVAANFLPFGTRFKVPALYGDKVFIVEDRMNKRYWQNVDIWMPDRSSALKFGRRQVVIELLAS